MIKFTYNSTNYTLGYSRKTVSKMEQKGFDARELDKYPATYFPMLFAGAFLLNHPTVKQTTIDEMYEHFENKEDLIAELGKMYVETITSLTDEPEESDTKKIQWEIA